MSAMPGWIRACAMNSVSAASVSPTTVVPTMPLPRGNGGIVNAYARRSRAARIGRHLRGQHGAILGGVVVLVLFLSPAFAGFIAPYDPADQIPGASLHGPSGQNLLGADMFGRDILS